MLESRFVRHRDRIPPTPPRRAVVDEPTACADPLERASRPRLVVTAETIGRPRTREIEDHQAL
jgi:hypothetical protein